MTVDDESVKVAVGDESTGMGVLSFVAARVAEGAVFTRAHAERINRKTSRINRKTGKRYRFCREGAAKIFMSILTISVGSHYTLLTSGCSAVGSAPRLGRGGRRFKSAHPDKKTAGNTGRRFPR